MDKEQVELQTSGVSESIGYLLRLASKHLRDQTIPVLKRHGLSPHELTTISVIRENPNCVLRSLAVAVAVEPPAMNRIINSLEEKGMIERRKSGKDARYTFFTLLPKGIECSEAARVDVRKTEYEALEPLAPDERAHLFGALKNLIHRADT